MAEVAAAGGKPEEAKVAQIPISEPGTGPRKIPKAVFIDDVEAWVEKYTDDALFAQMNELYQKYKFMENQLLKQRNTLRVKLPDIKKTLEMVILLKTKNAGAAKEVETNFLVSDNVWAKAKIPNDTGKVGLWLGANVMVEYGYDDALVLLGKNLANAEAKIAETEEEIDFLKDQITTTEVQMARVYNQGVANKQAAETKKSAAAGTK